MWSYEEKIYDEANENIHPRAQSINDGVNTFLFRVRLIGMRRGASEIHSYKFYFDQRLLLLSVWVMQL